MREHLPEPTVILEMPTPLSIRVRHLMRRVIRETRDALGFLIDAYGLRRAPKEIAGLSSFERITATNMLAAGDIRTMGRKKRWWQ